VDEGQPIAYEMLDEGVPVYASGGEQVGTVGAVVDAPEKDIFHGLLINTPNRGIRFVEAGSIASIHERGVDLRIDCQAASELPPPEHGAPVYGEDPSRQQGWRHWVHLITGRNDWNRAR
jgi:hypothetical protein